MSELGKYCCVLTDIHCAVSMLNHMKVSVGTAQLSGIETHRAVRKSRKPVLSGDNDWLLKSWP